MTLINCENDFINNCSENCVISTSTGPAKFTIIDKKLYVPVETLSIQDNKKALQQSKPGFKRIVNWNKYTSHAKENKSKPIFE